jgi:hypothetical protein
MVRVRRNFAQNFSLSGMVALGALFGTTAASAAENRGYVVDWFHIATAYVPANCPQGLNPLSDDFYKRELRRLGYPQNEVETLMKDFPNGGYIPITTMRGRVDGKPVNIYANPQTAPDPNLKPVKGTVAYGFNLDGKEGANDFVDPETAEKGVDNQMFRAVGCINNFAVSPPNLPIYPFAQWDLTRDAAPAWLIEIRGIDDPQNDDDVTIVMDRSVDVIARDTNGNATADMTMRVDPNSRSRNVVHGKIVNGMVISDKLNVRMEADPMLMPMFDFKEARVRFKMKDDGHLEGILGGYHAWWPIYWSYAQGGWIVEHSAGLDIPGIYYALKKAADADPDPKTGENRAISTAWRIDAAPAIVVSGEAKTAQK